MAVMTVERMIILVEIEDKTIHPVALTKEQEAKVLWLLEQLCGGKILLRKQTIEGIIFVSEEDLQKEKKVEG